MPIDPPLIDPSATYSGNAIDLGPLLQEAISHCTPTIVTALAEAGVAVIANALPARAVRALRDDLQNTALKPAGIGRGHALQHNANIRSDAIAWMTGTTAAQRAWLAAMEQLRAALNRELFLGLFDYECHYAHYQPQQFYRRHRDAFADNGLAGRNSAHSRVLSTVCYLNEQWSATDGGELAIYDNDEKPLLQIAPGPATLVIFLSEQFPHEVLPAAVDRFSIAGWFRRS